MKRRIETRNLRQFWRPPRNGSNRREIVRLMQRRQRHERIQLGDHVVVYTYRAKKRRSTMHHAMTDCYQMKSAALMTLPPIK